MRGRLNNRKAYMDAAWDWDWLNESWGAMGVSPTDIDGFVHCDGIFNHSYLIIETKREGCPPSRGQARSFDALASEPRHTVVVLYGDPPGLVTGIQVWPGPRVDADLETAAAWFKAWWRMASTEDRRG